MNKMSLTKMLLASTFLFYSTGSFAETNESADSSDDITLEELMNTQIYSASKRPEKLSDTASSVYVITSEYIKKSGVTSIPEALRMVPGVDVAQTNANTWAISIRGFNYQFSNKLLVMIDGRSVYTPLFSGVYWDSQDYVLEDIDRIEVIKGPGGTIWGANAVNGVINIITKEARKTQGNYVSVTAGTDQQGNTEYRYGGKTGEDGSDGFYRVYGKVNTQGQLSNVETHADNQDDWDKGQGGFRYDFRDWDYNKVTLQADFFSGRKSYPVTISNSTPASFLENVLIDENFQGANMMLNWNITTDKFNTDIKAYTDYTTRDDRPLLKQTILTNDVSIQTQYDYGINSFIGGGEIRYITDSLNNTPYISYSSPDSSVAILSTFLQDKIAVVADKLFLTLGSKFDYNDYTNFEVEPNARLSYQINEHHSVWTAISKAVRTPTRGEDGFSAYGITIPGAPLGTLSVTGNNSYGSEKLTAYEIGYRGDLSDKAFFDISTFYNDYDELRTTEATSGSTLASFNHGSGETYGVEAYSVIGVTDKWDLKPGYTLLEQNFHENTSDTLLARDEERSPEHQFSIGSFVKVAPDINWDTNLYYVSNLHYFTGAGVRTKIDAYARLDTQVRWAVMKDVELSLIGQNLLDDQHQEFNEILDSTPSEIPRTVLARASVKF
jgi:iron complex outermembrane receptor protein